MKTDAYGDTIWTRTYGDSLQEEAFLSHITSDGGYILSGFSDYHNADSSQMLLIKTDSFGFSGCYEFTSHPVIVSNLLAENNATYAVNSGMDIADLVLSTTNRIISDSTYCLLATGLNDFSAKNLITLYPNPASEILLIDGLSLEWVNKNLTNQKLIMVYDKIGKMIILPYSINANSNTLEVNVSTLCEGLYLLQIIAKNEKIVLKFIKE